MNNKVSDIIEAIAKTHATLFEIIFVKQNGDIRKMYAKTDVNRFKSKKPNKRKYTASKDVLIVADWESKSYKAIKPESILEFRCGNTIIKVND